ncbi:TadE/TadG family type IV pilus assembly protein [Streptomyces sp. NPDC088752]|uniref:TadE/TadG family type IV pilus assembly protein n=1 Tax=Streptomyces sp. NPDC088752 TaxID=3154963 RepID=UPI0013932914|nr:pilus assembly protein [Streptomyces sp. SID2131]
MDTSTHTPVTHLRTARTGSRKDDRGQAALEFLGWLPVLLLVGLLAVQLGLGAFAAQQAGTAARAAARVAADPDAEMSAQQAAQEAVSGWLADGTDANENDWGDGVTVTVRVEIPSVVPGIDFGPAEKSATMPAD